MRRIDSNERRARLVARHHLGRSARTVEEAAHDLVGLHSSDPVTVYLSLHARVAGFRVDDLERALYEDRTLVRILGMRRTLFVAPVDLAAVIDAACTRALAAGQRRRVARMVEEHGIAADGEAWVASVMSATLAALEDQGEAAATELVAVVPQLAEKVTFGEGREWGGTFGMSTRILFLLAAEGLIVRVRPRGSWISGQYRWTRVADWIPGGLPTFPAAEARVALAARWLESYGPGSFDDLKWWTGWGVRDTRAALESTGAVEVELDTGPGFVVAGDADEVPLPGDHAALLPSLDPTVMGRKDRHWFLGEHGAQLFDRNGNAGPTVWWNGRIVGGWAQLRSGEIAHRLLEDVGRSGIEAIEAGAARLEAWFGDVRITPRFRTPLDRELTG